MDQKTKDVLSFSMLLLFFNLKNILICVLIIFLSFVHHIIILLKPYDVNHLYLYKHVLSDMGIHLSKARKKTYIFIKLFKQDETK